MKAVFRIANRIRSAAPIPRDFLPIKGLDHLGLVYQQRIIDSADEFNATWKAINDPRFPSRGCSFLPYMLTPEDEAKLDAPAVAVPVETKVGEQDPAGSNGDEAKDEAESKADHDDAAINAQASNNQPKFTLVGNDIFMQGERVAGIYENGLRCAKGFSELRDELEAWLNTQP